MMLKKTIVALTVSVLFSAVMNSSAVAGQDGDSGYDPLYWNGPEGSSDYNILFRAGSRYSKARYTIGSRRSCSKLLRKYHRWGSRRALRRYHRCKARYQ